MLGRVNYFSLMERTLSIYHCGSLLWHVTILGEENVSIQEDNVMTQNFSDTSHQYTAIGTQMKK